MPCTGILHDALKKWCQLAVVRLTKHATRQVPPLDQIAYVVGGLLLCVMIGLFLYMFYLAFSYPGLRDDSGLHDSFWPETAAYVSTAGFLLCGLPGMSMLYFAARYSHACNAGVSQIE
ncbi:hypothetical protein CEE69_12350 [Rhodopirellula bahusiensis]|uniref:Uncharacterized protein n=1 Tax=Rhodopirellula bahusiensis TaxID=2014065 RepID=A0A2G1W824_9BACT|nr:hypothetical protein CEE69_12350 [Rhodopirellula bahusiensis]